MTVSIYSLTRSKMIEVIHYQICMNYAIISPDSKVLAAVGDENRIYFYHVKPCPKEKVSAPEEGKMLMGWEWPLIRTIDLESDSRYDDRCCFTIAFSPSSHLCATASQSGIITVFDMSTVLDTGSEGKPDHESILCTFRSSRSYFDGGAVRCMTFSPQPWDLLVWTEDNGRAGVADVRQAFSRRQILVLDPEDSELQKVRTEGIGRRANQASPDSESENRSLSRLEEPGQIDDDAEAINHLIDMMEDPSTERRPDSESRTTRDTLIHDISDRERQIIEFLGTTRWAPSPGEEGPPSAPQRINPLPPPSALLDGHDEGDNDFPRTSSPSTRYVDALHEFIRERHLERLRSGDRNFQPRRRGSVVLSQEHINNNNANSTSQSSNTSSPASHPGITLRWTASPSQIPSTTQPRADSNNVHHSITPPAVESTAATGANATSRPQDRLNRPRVPADMPTPGSVTNSSGRQRAQRSRSIPRRSERPEAPTEQEDSHTLLPPEIRSTLAAERLRLQRQAAVEESHRLTQWEQQYRQQLMGFDHNRSPRWTRNILSDMSDRNGGSRDPERGPGTAGIGWGADGRTLLVIFLFLSCLLRYYC